MFAEVLNDEFLLAAVDLTRGKLEKLLASPAPLTPVDDAPLLSFSVAEMASRPYADISASLADVDDGPLADLWDANDDDEPLHDISAEDVQEVINELAHAYRELEDERESNGVCIPSNPILAILQSELTELALARNAYAQRIGSTDRSIGGNLAPLPGAIVMRIWGPREVAKPDILSDPRWLWMRVVKGYYKRKHKAAFGGLPHSPVAVADNARIILVGDWGSGIRRARDVAGRIRRILDEGLKEGLEQHVIHLGDVYYTGSKREYERNFLRHWPVHRGEDIGSFIVCGNHDMYRGGHDYYGTALADPRFERQDQKSVFALHNANWQFLGIDTAYDDLQLTNGQDHWITGQLSTSHDRRTTMLSHHPLWSAYKPTTGTSLRSQLGPVLGDNRIAAWFWGHEHRCLVYKPREQVDFSSCVGHGGIPSSLETPKDLTYLKYDYRNRYGRGLVRWNTFGFAVIDLAGSDMHVRYIDEFGTTHHRENV